MSINIRIGSQPDFDRAVAVVILEAAQDHSNGIKYSDAIQRINRCKETMIGDPAPGKLFLATNGRKEGYIYNMLNFLINNQWLEEHKIDRQEGWKGAFPSKGSVLYKITDAGRQMLEKIGSQGKSAMPAPVRVEVAEISPVG